MVRSSVLTLFTILALSGCSGVEDDSSSSVESSSENQTASVIGGRAAAPEPSDSVQPQQAGGGAQCPAVTTLNVQSKHGAWDPTVSFNQVKTSAAVKNVFFGQQQPGGFVLLSNIDIDPSINTRLGLRDVVYTDGQAGIQMGFAERQPLKVGERYDINETGTGSLATGIRIKSGTTIQFGRESRGDVEITYVGSDKICGNIDLSDRHTSIKGRFVAPWRN